MFISLFSAVKFTLGLQPDQLLMCLLCLCMLNGTTASRCDVSCAMPLQADVWRCSARRDKPGDDCNGTLCRGRSKVHWKRRRHCRLLP